MPYTFSLNNKEELVLQSKSVFGIGAEKTAESHSTPSHRAESDDMRRENPERSRSLNGNTAGDANHLSPAHFLYGHG